jgi:hypothetical protein
MRQFEGLESNRSGRSSLEPTMRERQGVTDAIVWPVFDGTSGEDEGGAMPRR